MSRKGQCASCAALKRENRRLDREVARMKRATERLKEKLLRLKERFEKRIAALKQRFREEKAKLKALLDKARRSGKRQAAPFSKGPPKKKPRRPGRRSGKRHGRHGHRPVPDRVDEVLEAPLPERSSCCGAEVEEDGVAQQYQVDIPPVKPQVTQINVHVGHCTCCNKRVQGRHPRQTSDALGAAASQVGPRAKALAADMSKAMGVSFEKVSKFLERHFKIPFTRGGICQAMHRVAKAAGPTYESLCARVRQDEVVSPDETGWKVGGERAWLWVFACVEVTVYAILGGRGFEEAASVLGADFSGALARDGWAPYRKFEDALHQTCLNHLLNRCHELLETAQQGAARFPWAVKRLLQDGLALRDRRDAGLLSPHGLKVAVGRLEARADRLLAWRPTNEDNRRFVEHLNNEREALFTFLKRPDVPATNYRAEQAIRPAVVMRKMCGGNRTWNGAHTQEVTTTLFRTCDQQGRDPYEVIVFLLCSPVPIVAEWLCIPDEPPPNMPLLPAPS